jgi:hypothetical protein
MIGAAMLVGALWAIGSLICSKITRQSATFVLFYGCRFTGSVLTYAVAFAFDLPFCNIAQKFAVFGWRL